MHASLISRLCYPALLLLLVAGLTGCSEDGVSPDDTTKPGVGSTFTVAAYYTNAAGTPDPLSYDTTTTTLSEIHDSFKGKSDVYEFTSKFGSTFQVSLVMEPLALITVAVLSPAQASARPGQQSQFALLA